MKTALESYIDWLKSNIKIAEEYQLNNITLLNVCLENAERFLPMEKEQIIDAVVNTVKIGTEKESVLLFTSEDEILIKKEAEEYYNETFKSE